MDELWVARAGLISYDEGHRAQLELAAARHAGRIPDTVLVLEHQPVYTKGRRWTAEELPMGEDWYRMQGIEVAETDRGGRVTYHGPGQLVAYPIIDLRQLDDAGDVRAFVRHMEGSIIDSLRDHGVEAGLIDGLTGVWVGEDPPPAGAARKIGSIGIHISRGISTHGLAINVNNDLQPFEWIVPCGIEAVRMTSLSRELGREQDLDAFADTLIGHVANAYRREPVEVEADTVLASSSTSLR